jgi:hypothetical protein
MFLFFHLKLINYLGPSFANSISLLNDLPPQIRDACLSFRYPVEEHISSASKLLDPSKISFKTFTFFQRTNSDADKNNFKNQVEEFHRRFKLESTIMCLNGNEIIQAGDNISHGMVWEEWAKIILDDGYY